MSENSQNLTDRYRKDPVAFARDFLAGSAEQWRINPWQEELLRSFERGERRVFMGVDVSSGPDYTVFSRVPDEWFAGGRGGKVAAMRRAEERHGLFTLELVDGVWQLPR